MIVCWALSGVNKANNEAIPCRFVLRVFILEKQSSFLFLFLFSLNQLNNHDSQQKQDILLLFLLYFFNRFPSLCSQINSHKCVEENEWIKFLFFVFFFRACLSLRIIYMKTEGKLCLVWNMFITRLIYRVTKLPFLNKLSFDCSKFF